MWIFFCTSLYFEQKRTRNIHKIKEQYRQKSKNREKNGQSKRQQQPRRKSTQREGTGDEKVSYSTTTCASIFFLAACFFGVRGKVKNFFLLQLPLHCDGRGKKSRSGEDLKHAHWTCYVVVCASSPFSARKRRSVGRGMCGRRRVGVSGDGEEGNTTQLPL